MILTASVAPVSIRRPNHENWILPESRDVGFSSGVSYYHQAVLDTDGILYPCSWLAMEPSYDSYDFTNLVKTLDYANSFGKKVIIRVFYKSYSGVQAKPLPSYILNDHATYGGVSGSGGLRSNSLGGYTPRFDNEAVLSRFKRLITVMAAAVGGHSALQGVGPDESAWSFGGLWGTTGLVASQVRDAHRDKCSHFQACFPSKEVYPFYNYCDGSSDAEVINELQWSWQQGMCAGVTDAMRLIDMSASVQPIAPSYPIHIKTLMCVDYMSTGDDDSSLTERMLENARTTAAYGANITAWYCRGGASGNYWAAIKNAINKVG